MRARSRAGFAVLAAAVVFGSGGAVAFAQQTPAAAAPPSVSSAARDGGYAVTLVTGDQVTVIRAADGHLITGVRRGPGREDVGFVKRGHSR